MDKIYWWCKKPLMSYNTDLKEQLMYLIDKKLYFKLDLLSSKDPGGPYYFLFGSNSYYTMSCEDEGLYIKNYYTSIRSNCNYSFKNSSIFENRLINAEYSITLLSEQEYNDYIK